MIMSQSKNQQRVINRDELVVFIAYATHTNKKHINSFISASNHFIYPKLQPRALKILSVIINSHDSTK